MKVSKYLTINNSDSQKIIRTISTILIMFVHISDGIKTPGSPFLIFTPYGYLCVGIFFFFTGYNLITSFKKHNSISKGFLLNKFYKVFIPSSIANVLYGLIIIYYSGRMKLLKWATLINLANGTMWYINSVLCIYVIYFILFSLLSLIIKKYSLDNRHTNIAICIFSILVFAIYACVSVPMANMIGVTFMQNNSRPLSLIVGMLLAVIECRIDRTVFSKKWLLAIIFGLLTVYCHGQNMKGVIKPGLLTDNITDYLAPVSFALTLYFAFYNIRFKSKIIDFLYTISLEIYILHHFFLMLFRTKIYITNDVVYVLVYIVTLIIGSYLLNILKKYIEKLFNGVLESIHNRKAKRI